MLEVTARLTLQTSVSQLTEFYNSTILELIIENGMGELRINLVSPDGELYPYYIILNPEGSELHLFKPNTLQAFVVYTTTTSKSVSSDVIFTTRMSKGAMTTQNLYKCALHVCGDFIKFNEKGL